MKIWRSTHVLILSFAFTLMFVSGFFGLSLLHSQASMRFGAKLSNQQQDHSATSQIQGADEAETRIRNGNLLASADNQVLNRRAWQMPSKASVQLPSKRYGWTPENFEVTRRLARFELEKYRPSQRNEIGLARKVEWTTDETASKQIGRYTHNPDGSQLRFITLQSPGAVELRVHFSKFNLPEGEEIYVYGVGTDDYVAGPYSGSGPRNPNKIQGQGKDAASADFWSDTIPGDTVIIEHYGKAELSGSFAVPEIAHNYKSFLSAATSAPAEFLCHFDAKCVNDALNNAVGQITFMKGSNSYGCSGTLVASGPEGEFAPYFLTANHCLNTATVAATVQPLWKYRSVACGSSQAESVVGKTGASLLKTKKATDQTLLRILNGVPDDLTYAGWISSSPPEGSSVYGLHHPGSTFLRRSEGKISNTDKDCDATGLNDGYGINWSKGLIEPGSSGSALFLTSNSKVMGVASCVKTDQSCGDSGEASYGKFSHFYPFIQTYLKFGDRGDAPTPPIPALGASGPFTINDTLTSAIPSRVYGEGAENNVYYGKVFGFSGLAGQKVTITLASNAFDAYLYLLSPVDHVLLAEDDDSGGGSNAKLSLTLPESGFYLIEATTTEINQTGAFTLQVGLECAFTVSKEAEIFSAAGGANSVILGNTTKCPWIATSDSSWLKVSPASGAGGATINYTAESNPTSFARSATLKIAGQTITITQKGTCNTNAISFGQILNRTLTPNDCLSPNTSGPDAPYADLYSFTASTGVKIHMSASSDVPGLAPVLRLMRSSGQILVSDLNETNHYFARIPNINGSYTIPASGTYLIEVTTTTRQDGGYTIALIAECNYSVPIQPAVFKEGKTFDIPVNTTSGCPWTAINYASWIKINSGASGTGPGTVNVTVAPNTSVKRKADLYIAGNIVTIAQDDGCSYVLTPASRNFVAGGGSGSVNVTAAAGCPWQVSTNTSWLLVGNSPNQIGSGVAQYGVQPYRGATPRTGTITIAGQSHTVTQSGTANNPTPIITSISPKAAFISSEGFRLTVFGQNFVRDSVIRWNGANRETVFVNDGTISMDVTPADLAVGGTVSITVFTPLPGGGLSNAAAFIIVGRTAHLSAASFGRGISANSITAVFGAKLATRTVAAETQPLPTTLGGTTVKITDRLGVERTAPLFFVSAAQINYLVPPGTADGTANVVITSEDGSVSMGEITVTGVAPALFAANANGRGAPAAVVLRVAANGTQSYEAVAEFDRATNRWVPRPLVIDNAREQVFLILFGSGLRARSSLNAVTAMLGREKFSVAFAGAQGGLAGLDQVNLLLQPRLAGSGEIGLSMLVDGTRSNAVTLLLR